MKGAAFPAILFLPKRAMCVRRIGVAMCILLLGFPGHAAAALEFFSMADTAVIMYDAPSLKAEKIYVVSQYLPVEAASSSPSPA